MLKLLDAYFLSSIDEAVAETVSQVLLPVTYHSRQRFTLRFPLACYETRSVCLLFALVLLTSDIYPYGSTDQ